MQPAFAGAGMTATIRSEPLPVAVMPAPTGNWHRDRIDYSPGKFIGKTRPSMSDDPALDTLLHPFSTGAISLPEDGRILFLRARAGSAGAELPRQQTVCEQSFKPFADALIRDGYQVSEPTDETFSLILVLPPRQREEARALLAQAILRATPGAIVMASMSNSEGARSGEADLEALAGNIH